MIQTLNIAYLQGHYKKVRQPFVNWKDQWIKIDRSYRKRNDWKNLFYKKRRSKRSSISGGFEASTIACQVDGCNKEGKFRAPKSPKDLDNFFWFCLSHVKEYNNRWNYFQNHSEEEFDKVVEFSQNTENLEKRYVVACSIISSLMLEKLPELVGADDSVDLSICKLLMDGVVEIEPFNKSIH